MRTALLSIALVALPSIAHAQPRWEDVRLGGHFALGLAGDAEASVGSVETSASLDPTVGGGVRVGIPLHEYFLASASFEILTFEQDAVGAEREAVLDFDLILTGRYPFELNADLGLEPYLSLVVGPSIGVFNDPDGTGDEAWPGWNIGVLGGAALLLDVFGVFLEAGWRFHQAFTEARFLGVDRDFQIHTHQFALQVGGFVRL